MVNNCLRCGEQEELRRGSVTGEKVATYSKLKNKINDSGILKLISRLMSNTLCLRCLKELAEWLRNPKKHVR